MTKFASLQLKTTNVSFTKALIIQSHGPLSTGLVQKLYGLRHAPCIDFFFLRKTFYAFCIVLPWRFESQQSMAADITMEHKSRDAPWDLEGKERP